MWQLLMDVNQAYQQLLVVHSKFRDINKVLFSCLMFYALSVCLKSTPCQKPACLTGGGPCRLKAGRPWPDQPEWLPFGSLGRREPSSGDCLPFMCLTLFKWNCPHLGRMCGLIFFTKASIRICPESYLAHLWRNHVEEGGKINISNDHPVDWGCVCLCAKVLHSNPLICLFSEDFS